MQQHSGRHRAAATRLLRLLLSIGLVWALAGVGVARGQTSDEPPPEATAADDAPERARWAVQPSGPDGPGGRDWFIYTLKPGAVFGDVVAVSNLSDRPVRFIIYTSDVQAVADVGGLAPEREDVAPDDVGSWIELAATERTVQPGTRIDLPFSVTVPADAEPGDHVGAIIAIDADEAVVDPSESEDLGFQLRQRIGARVYVRVEGPHDPDLSVSRLDVEHDNPVLPTGGTATIRYEIVNNGNLRLEPDATMRITGFLGRTVKEVPMPEIPELLPGGNFVGSVTVEGLPPIERFRAELDIAAIGVDASRGTTFWPVPWLLVLLLVPAAWAARRRYLRRRHRRAARPMPPPAPAPREPVGV